MLLQSDVLPDGMLRLLGADPERVIFAGEALIPVLSFLNDLQDEVPGADLIAHLVVVSPQVGGVIRGMGPGAAQDALQGHLLRFLHLGEQAERVQIGYYRGILKLLRLQCSLAELIIHIHVDRAFETL